MKQFLSIQYLRAVAALMVVFHHARNPHPWLFHALDKSRIGESGVDIFFVISGFIMFTAARNESVPQFGWRRFARIAPLYWIATFATVAVHLAMHQLPSRLNLLQSLIFLPHYSSDHPDQIWPYLVQGWTLSFEVFFYAIFAVGLFVRKLLPITFGIIGLCVVAGLFIKLHNPLWLTYTSPLLLEFLAGVIIARWREFLTPKMGGALLPIGFALLFVIDLTQPPMLRLWGIPAAMIVAGALAIERHMSLPKIRMFELLGNASYSIYLFQSFGMLAGTSLAVLLPLTGPLQLFTTISACLIIATVIGLLAHLYIEKPVLKLLMKRRTTANPEVVLQPLS